MLIWCLQRYPSSPVDTPEGLDLQTKNNKSNQASNLLASIATRYDSFDPLKWNIMPKSDQCAKVPLIYISCEISKEIANILYVYILILLLNYMHLRMIIIFTSILQFSHQHI